MMTPETPLFLFQVEPNRCAVALAKLTVEARQGLAAAMGRSSVGILMNITVAWAPSAKDMNSVGLDSMGVSVVVEPLTTRWQTRMLEKANAAILPVVECLSTGLAWAAAVFGIALSRVLVLQQIAALQDSCACSPLSAAVCASRTCGALHRPPHCHPHRLHLAQCHHHLMQHAVLLCAWCTLSTSSSVLHTIIPSIASTSPATPRRTISKIL